MKVCILSMQRVQNFGSLLQSYALKKMLEQQGFSVDFLDIEPNWDDNLLLEGKKNVFLNEGEPSGTILAKLRKIDRYTLNRFRMKYRSIQQNKKFEEFREKELGVTDSANAKSYDYCVVGSDEVFNCLSGAPWGFTSQLFGNVRQAAHVITYAASCGATLYENVPEKARERIKTAFERIDSFSVRDDNTYRFVSCLTDKPVEQHLDPVMIYDFSVEMENAKLPKELPERYCLIYSYYNRFCEQDDIGQILRFCHNHKLVPITVGCPQKWINSHLVVDPFEMLKVFRNAEFVITDTFHGTIFSAKYANCFAVLSRGSNRNKLLDLIRKLYLETQLIGSLDELEAVYACDCKTNQMYKIIETEKENTKRYLVEYIRGQ